MTQLVELTLSVIPSANGSSLTPFIAPPRLLFHIIPVVAGESKHIRRKHWYSVAGYLRDCHAELKAKHLALASEILRDAQNDVHHLFRDRTQILKWLSHHHLPIIPESSDFGLLW
ncbi:MAG: hypothetical protein ACFFCW_29535 [Candidatus Hodarchaeota archaeon]